MPRLEGWRGGVGERAEAFRLDLISAFWILTTFELDLFLAATIGGPFYRIPLFLAAVLGLRILYQIEKRVVYWPLIVFALLHLGASLLAENAGLSRDALTFMVYMLILFSGSVAFLDSPSRVIGVLKLYLLSFAWYGLQGIPSGRVGWHPLLANEDSYGPLMVMAMAFSYFFAQATSSARWRWLARGMFLLSVLGVVASLARGACVAAGVVLLFILLRSPNKAKALAGLALATIVLLPVAAMIVPLDAYVGEIRSISEGDEGRIAVWKMAWNVFLESPVYGVGAFNFGVVAAKVTSFEAARAVKSDPAQLYSHGVHNLYLQILAEEGLIGVALWFAMIVGFFRRNGRLRKGDARARWAARGGRDMDLRMVSLGLEGAMVGFLICSIFYNQLYIHWFWSLLTISYVLAELTGPTREGTKGQVSGHASEVRAKT